MSVNISENELKNKLNIGSQFLTKGNIDCFLE